MSPLRRLWCRGQRRGSLAAYARRAAGQTRRPGGSRILRRLTASRLERAPGHPLRSNPMLTDAGNGVVRVAVKGELDLSSVAVLEHAVDDALADADGGGTVELDL